MRAAVATRFHGDHALFPISLGQNGGSSGKGPPGAALFAMAEGAARLGFARPWAWSQLELFSWANSH